MTRLWLVRLGKFGETEQRALESAELVTGWTIGDLSKADSRDQVLQVLLGSYPEKKLGTLKNWAAQLNQFKNEVQPGDLTITPLKSTGQIAIGRVVDGYTHADGRHPTRRVVWLNTDVRRDAIKQDLLYSLGASQTICEISRNNAAQRIETLLKLGRDPGDGGRAIIDASQSRTDENMQVDDVDLAQATRDQIVARIGSSFAGHAFTELIAAILRAQGYQARVSPPGGDRGVDIVAGQGSLGFGGPQLVVQVKSGGIVADQPTLQALLGARGDTGAEHGLLVSWSGFTSAVRQRTNELYFKIRLWGQDEILDALFATYDHLPEEIRAELPLRRIWALVPDDDAS